MLAILNKIQPVSNLKNIPLIFFNLKEIVNTPFG